MVSALCFALHPALSGWSLSASSYFVDIICNIRTVKKPNERRKPLKKHALLTRWAGGAIQKQARRLRKILSPLPKSSYRILPYIVRQGNTFYTDLEKTAAMK